MFKRRALFAALILLCLVRGDHHRACVIAQEGPAAANVAAISGYERVAELLSAAVRFEVREKDLPALSIALVDDSKVVYAQGFGFQDEEKKVPATARTIYRVGSVSKLFTDVAIMQLVERGKVSIDEPVQKYLPSFAPKSSFDKPITLRQLMAHRSGLVRESPVGNYFDPTEPSLSATIGSLNGTSLVYAPDVKTKYSNAGITVVGAVLEKESSVPFATVIDRQVLQPLAMKSSGFERRSLNATVLATGWMWTYDGRRFPAPDFALGTAPAGNLYSSVLDLSKFTSELFAGGQGEKGAILNPETLEQMLSPQGKRNESGKSVFGIGFHLQTLDGHKKIGHGGAVYGFATQLEALPEKRLGVAAVASLDCANSTVSKLANYSLRLLLAHRDGKPLPEYEFTQSVPAERGDQLAGSYKEGGNSLELRYRNGRLQMRRGVFRADVRMQGIDFVVDGPLAYGTKLTVHDKGSLEIDGKRFERVDLQSPELCPRDLQEFIGEYGWDHNTLYILEDRGQLFALIEWFYYYPLTKISDDVFAFPDYGLYHGEQIVFQRDPDGRVTSAIAACVKFDRRKIDGESGETFRIEPVRPIDELRIEASQATPPIETGEFSTSDIVDVVALDPSIRLDVRYATTNNFTGAVFYQQARAFMQRPAAEALVRVQNKLRGRGVGLLIHDAYRPWSVTKMFWEATPTSMKQFVANPANGSRHNRGCAVDLTLCDLSTSAPIELASGYDEFSFRAYPDYPGGTSRQRWHRELLRDAMESEGFAVYEHEWWHFDFKDWKRYRIQNVPFESIDIAATK